MCKGAMPRTSGWKIAAVREGQLLAGSVSTRPSQEADFRIVRAAGQGQLSAKSANWCCRPQAGTRERHLHGCPRNDPPAPCRSVRYASPAVKRNARRLLKLVNTPLEYACVDGGRT